jgi:hypothetical protein
MSWRRRWSRSALAIASRLTAPYAKKLVGLYRAGLLRFVHPPTPELEGLRDLLRCRDDLRCARTAARHRVLKQLLRHSWIFRDGKTAFSQQHRRWINVQRLADPLAQLALEQLLIHLDGIARQLDTRALACRRSRAASAGARRSRFSRAFAACRRRWG